MGFDIEVCELRFRIVSEHLDSDWVVGLLHCEKESLEFLISFWFSRVKIELSKRK